MHVFAPDTVAGFLHHWGLLAVFTVIALESMGVPMPGEATLVSAALLAGTTHGLSITAVIATAALAAIVGDNMGYLIGRRFGPALLLRFGGRMGLDAARLKLGRYLFLKHGGKVVFFGRFVAVLRAFAAVLAGANLYPWPHFLAFNAAGAIVWAGLYGSAAYLFGDAVHRVAAPAALLLAIVAAATIALMWRAFRRQETRWIAEAEIAFPGPSA